MGIGEGKREPVTSLESFSPKCFLRLVTGALGEVDLDYRMLAFTDLQQGTF